EYLRALMLVKLGNGADTLNLPQDTLASLKAQAAKTDAATIVRATTLFNKATSDIKSALLTIPQLPLELAFVEVTTGSIEPASLSSPSMPATVATTARPRPSSRPSPPPPAASLPISQVPVAVDDSDLTVDSVRGCFMRVLQEIEMKNKVMAEALRTQTRLYKVAGNQIYFVTVEVMKERFEKPQPQSALNDAFSRIIGRPVSIHFMLESDTSDPVQKDDQSNEDHLIELVKVAEDLGGQVVEE
ncbi:MAG: hypothetical protein R3264_11585, partial [Anaerolineae bacterium]|nr:hypothetical protein [Anaerolineae bacterium]